MQNGGNTSDFGGYSIAGKLKIIGLADKFIILAEKQCKTAEIRPILADIPLPGSPKN